MIFPAGGRGGWQLRLTGVDTATWEELIMSGAETLDSGTRTHCALQFDLPRAEDRACYSDGRQYFPSVWVALGPYERASFPVRELAQRRRRWSSCDRHVHEGRG